MSYFKNFQTNKYKAKKTMYKGMKYDSKKEAGQAFNLEMLKKAKEIKDYESHKRYDFYGINGNKICSYIADFVITHNDGTIEIMDVKSKATVTPIFRLKWRLLEDLYKSEIKRGEIKLTIEY